MGASPWRWVRPRGGSAGEGVLKKRPGAEWLDAHPDSGAAFRGRLLPHWDRMVEACTRGAQAPSNLRLTGWAVAMAEEGPVILEANTRRSLLLMQVHGSGYLTPDVRRELADLGVEIRQRLPSLTASAWADASRLARRITKERFNARPRRWRARRRSLSS